MMLADVSPPAGPAGNYPAKLRRASIRVEAHKRHLSLIAVWTIMSSELGFDESRLGEVWRLRLQIMEQLLAAMGA